MMEVRLCAMTNKIIFHSNKIYNTKESEPRPTATVTPKWWKDADMFVKDNYGNYIANWSGQGRMPTFKACPALLDGFTTGYVLITPCDIEFYEKRGRKKVKTEIGFEDFVGDRDEMPGFLVPEGYDKKHFHWYANWAPQLPSGYSSLYIPPMNNFELPFLTTAGIIDSDKVTNSGLIPFFLRKDFLGVIPKGTPYLQIIPFKRDDWEAEYIHHSPTEIHNRTIENSNKFRTVEGGVYKKYFWSKRKYK